MMRNLRVNEEKERKKKYFCLKVRRKKSSKKEKNWIISRIAGSYLSGDFKVAGTIARKAGGPVEALSLASINPLVSGTNPERKYMSAYCGTSILRN